MKDFALDLLAIGLWVFALARLTRLIVTDEISDPIRLWVFEKFGEHSKLGYLVICPWCMSIWIGFATAPYLVWFTGIGWYYYPLVALAGSYYAGISAENLESDDDGIEITVEDDGGRHSR